MAPSIDRSVTQTARIGSCVAWAALAYVYFHDSTCVAMGGSSQTIVPVSIFSITALISGFLSMACALPSLNGDIADRSAWGFVIWCSLPFFLTVGLLNPYARFYL